jgi:transposase
MQSFASPVRVTYEAGPTGFGLARAITEAGMERVVAAPSKLQRPAGDRVKTDARDAAHLARLLRLGEITAVRVPEREIEAVRDLVRAREDARADLMRVRHRLSKLLLRRGIVYSGGTPWTCAHEEWLRRHRFDDFTSRRPSITASTRCWRRPRRGTALTSRSWWWPPRRGSPTRSTGWVVCAASPH